MKAIKIILLVLVFMSVGVLQFTIGKYMNDELFLSSSLMTVPAFAYVYYLLFDKMSKC